MLTSERLQGEEERFLIFALSAAVSGFFTAGATVAETLLGLWKLDLTAKAKVPTHLSRLSVLQ